MDASKSVEAFERSVKNKFNLYNSLFLNLPYSNVENIGTMIPVLQRECKLGLDKGFEPKEILDQFFSNHNIASTEEEKIDFMFRVIQYVERQVVLFDSVEDAALPHIRRLGNDLSINDFAHQFESERSLADITKKLSSFSARIVFTAHPTQFYPPRVLDIIAKLRDLIKENNIDEINITLQQLGLTSLLNPHKPTPLDEARNIIYFLRHVYYDAVGELYRYIKNITGNEAFDNPGLIKLGFWPGGDRDGNPYVTTETTLAVADELRMSLMKCYYRDVSSLEHKLTFKGVENTIGDLKAKIYKAMFDPSSIVNYNTIMKSLNQVKKSVKSGYNGLYMEEIDALMDKVRIFKTHFATLDIRQNHDVHEKAVEIILKKEKIIKQSLDELSENELAELLINKKFTVELQDFEDKIVRDTLQIISRIGEIQDKNGEEGCNRYIISHSEDIFSVLFVFALFRWCSPTQDKMAVDIIPLFESMEGMENAGKIMDELFHIGAYRNHVKQRNNKQTMMLGFSDGTKDGGYLEANWNIYKTKENLTSVCNDHGISAIFFDGRGGPPARGGGKTHRFYAAQGDRIANHEIQLTIQGQTISSKYGTREHFIHNSEQLITASLYNHFFDTKNRIPEESRSMIERLARISFNKYNALKNHEKFIPYLENRSTLKYYGETNIGSRPAKRGHKKQLNLDDLRAISYVGSWSQLKQNVPGYFGIGTALKTLADEGLTEHLQHLFQHVPFFKALMLNSMMALTKCYFELTAYMDKDEEYREFWNILYDEYKLSKEMLLLISGYEILMEEEPVSRNSVAIREKLVLPLLVIQQYALQQIEQGSDLKEIYQRIVKRSLYGNINASRNSA